MKKITLLFLLPFFLLAFSGNANGQGGTLPLNGSVNGNLTSSTPDVWDVTTNSDGLLRLTFTTVSPADLYLTLYDNDGTTAISATAESYNNSTVTVTVDGLAPGTYHAKIIPFSTAYGLYTLSDSLFTPAVSNDAEPNGSASTAAVLPPNSTQKGNVGYYYNNQRDTTDWYKVTTTADGLLRVYLTTDSASIYSTTTTNPLDVIVTLYDNNGTTQLGYVEVFNGSGPATNMITADGLAPGTYYIKVQPYATSEFANYTLSDSLFVPQTPNDAEPIGAPGSAIVFPMNSNLKGHVGYYYNNQRDTADYYQLTTTTTGPLYVYLNTLRGSVYSNNTLDMILTFYSSDGTTQLGSIEVYNAANPGIDSLFFPT